MSTRAQFEAAMRARSFRGSELSFRPDHIFFNSGTYADGYVQSAWVGWQEAQKEMQKLRAALEYTNVLLERMPQEPEVTYRINQNKAVLNATKD